MKEFFFNFLSNLLILMLLLTIIKYKKIYNLLKKNEKTIENRTSD